MGLDSTEHVTSKPTDCERYHWTQSAEPISKAYAVVTADASDPIYCWYRTVITVLVRSTSYNYAVAEISMHGTQSRSRFRISSLLQSET